ncbi:MAG: PmoA family protein [Rubripirellula sp.]
MSRNCLCAAPSIRPNAMLALGLALGILTLPPVEAQTPSAAEKITIEESTEPAGWNIRSGDELFAGYMLDSNGKPILYPVIGPGGHAMTRDFPMKGAGKHERDDHDHHRSFWLTHGDVNGIDFWLDDKHCGKIVHRDGSVDVAEDGSAVLVSHNDWLDPDGKIVLSDTRRLTFRDVGDRRIIDCDFLLKATNGDVNFGDTKEGSFGIRTAGTMKVDAKMGGLITNAEGKHNKDAWGKKSAWVNYSGPVDEDTVGITIHDHPSSFGYPCRWHVRTYGLFAANPFGVHHFVGGEKTDGIVLKAGDEMRLNYRVVLSEGEFDADQTSKDAETYAETTRPALD